RKDEGKRQFPLRQVRKKRLTRLLAGVVDHVVDQLKGDPQLFAEDAKGVGRLLVRPCETGASLSGKRKQRRRLVRENTKVGLLRGVKLRTPAKLNDLPVDQAAQRANQRRKQ